MSASGDQVNSKQPPVDHGAEARSVRLLEALMVYPTLHQAAQAASVPYSTARRLFRNEDFQRDLQAARREAFEVTLGRLRLLASQAMDVLERAVQANDVRVAEYILDRAAQQRDDDLEERVTALEKARGTSK